MNKKRRSTVLIVIIMLLSLAVSAFTVQAATLRTVYGKVSIDEGFAPNGTTVKLEFDTQEITNVTYEDGHYVMRFSEDDWEEGTFSVYYLGVWYPTTPSTVDLEDQQYHLVNLSVSTAGNNPPNTPSNPSPTGSSVGINADLSWTCSDPDGDDLTYDVYFEANDPTPDELVSNNQSETTYDPGTMNYGTHYYWQIVAWDEHGATSSGPIWSFTTAAYTPPYDPPYNPPDTNQNPTADANGPYSGFIDEEITFNGSDSSDSDGTITNYTWNFGDNTTGYGVNPTHTYDTSREYTIVLTVTDDDGAKDTNETTAEIIQPNIPPTDPVVVNGTQEGTINTTYEFTFMSTDDDGDNVSYYIEWGDDQTNETAFVPNGTQVTLNHTWSTPGNYTIKVTAQDNETPSGTTEYLVSIEEEKEPTPEEEYDYTWLILLLILIIILLILLWLIKRKKPEEKKQPPKKTGNTSKKPSKKTGKK